MSGRRIRGGCIIDGCDKPHRGKGYCTKHLTRVTRYGSPFIIKLDRQGSRTNEEYFWSKVNLTANPDKCWLWKGFLKPRYYPQLRLSGVPWRGNKYAWFLKTGDADPQGVIRHSCDNRACVNPRHMEIGTYADNSRDMVERGRSCKGERHHGHKITEQDVSVIRQRLGQGEKQSDIGRDYGLNQASIGRIKRGEAWSHV